MQHKDQESQRTHHNENALILWKEATRYDQNGNIVEVTQNDETTKHYRYDQHDRLVNDDHLDHTFTYDAINNLIAYDQHQLSVNGSNEYTSHTYDTNGNLQHYEGRTFTYDYRNRLHQVTQADGSTITYGYDALNQRILKVEDGTTTHYLYHNGQIIQTYQNDTPHQTFVYGNYIDDPLAMIMSETTYYYLKDRSYSIQALVDEMGEVVEQYAYTPFGETTIYDQGNTIRDTSNYTNPFGYTGREYDATTTLYHYRNRTYNPQLARFMQRDPKGYVDGLNLYAYVSNNPLRYSDPMGTMKATMTMDQFNTSQELWNERLEFLEDSVDSLNEGYLYVDNQINDANQKMFNIFNGASNISDQFSNDIVSVADQVNDVTLNDVDQLVTDFYTNLNLLYDRRDQIEINKALNGGWNGMIDAHNNAPWYAKGILYTSGLSSLAPLSYTLGAYSVPALGGAVGGTSSLAQNFDK
jgi:RHS repeat-associated protein